MKLTTVCLISMACMLLLAGCGRADADKGASDEGGGTTASELVLNGERVGGVPKKVSRKKPGKKSSDTTDDKPATKSVMIPHGPPLLADGTIDDGPDPFAGLDPRVEAQPLPIDGNGGGIDPVARENERSDDEPLVIAARRGVVQVFADHCGGGKLAGTGFVYADETVITTARMVQSIQRRIRVKPMGTTRHIPAMIIYLDVDDDIAVLRVPGLNVAPLPTAATVVGGEDAAILGYAMGYPFTIEPARLGLREQTLTTEQSDGFGERIRNRRNRPVAGFAQHGHSGAPVVLINGAVAGMIRAQVPTAAQPTGLMVPLDLLRTAWIASDSRYDWQEIKPSQRMCPQWTRPRGNG